MWHVTRTSRSLRKSMRTPSSLRRFKTMSTQQRAFVFSSSRTLEDLADNNNTPTYRQTASLSIAALSIVDESSEQAHVRTAATSAPTTLERHTPPEEIRALWNTLLASQQVLPRSVLQVEKEGLATTGSTLAPKEQTTGEDEPWVQYFCDLGSSSGVLLPHSQETLESVDAFEREIVLDDSDSQVKDDFHDVFTAETAEPKEQELFVPHPLEHDLTKLKSEKEAFRKIRSKISEAMNTHKIKRAFALFERAVREGFAQDFPDEMVRSLFFQLAEKHPFQANKVLRFYQHMTAEQKGGDINAYIDEYARLCDSFRHFNPKKDYNQDIRQLVNVTAKDLQRLDDNGKQRCYPILVSALVEQKKSMLGVLARNAYQYMIDHEFVLPPGYWEHLLSFSKFYRQDDLPYADILERAIEAGRRPDPMIVLNALRNLFPYHDTGATFRMLKSIVRLQKTSQDGDAPYLVDMAVLEAIGAAAASKGFGDMNLVIWDMIDLLGDEPTEFIYENTIVAFCTTPSTFANAFTVLADMEEKGMEPSRALIRSMSTYLRQSPRNLEIALETLKDLRQQGRPTTVAALNAVLSGAAERGDIDRSMSILDDFARCNVEPNADSFSFAMEAFGKSLSRRTKTPATDQLVVSCLEMADSLLNTMEERGIAPTHHIIREYVELLCIVNEVETATSVVEESVKVTGLVNNKILYRVAVANADLGRFDTARKCASYATEPMPFLLKRIDRMEALQED